MPIKLLTVIGARPQIIKAAALSRAIKTHFSDVVEEYILHTGQHYDENMSAVFFEELGIPQPHYNLGVGSGRHGAQTAKMICGIEDVLLQEKMVGVVLYGDTNSTLAGAVAASKLHIPIFHVEAGLRSFNMAMPEEVNRIVCDQLSSICFAPTQTAVENLRREGFFESSTTFADGNRRKVVLSGDVMYDNSLHFAPIAEKKSRLLQEISVEKNQYILATIHRDYNTDHQERMEGILNALEQIAQEEQIPVVLPLHPRTKNILEKQQSRILKNQWFKIISPAGFLDMIALERGARIVMTDSGGVQKEAFFYERPCVILRSETEWVEIVNEGAGIVADASTERIQEAYHKLVDKEVHFPPLFGDGNAAERIVREIKGIF